MTTSTTTFLKAFVTAFILFVLGDMLWHTILFGDFYNGRIALLNGGTLPPMSFPYFIFAFEFIAAAGTVYFVLPSRSVQEGAWKGALLGLMMVSAINFVCHTLITNWDLTLVGVDTMWGVVLGAITGAAIMMVSGKKLN